MKKILISLMLLLIGSFCFGGEIKFIGNDFICIKNENRIDVYHISRVRYNFNNGIFKLLAIRTNMEDVKVETKNVKEKDLIKFLNKEIEVLYY